MSSNPRILVLEFHQETNTFNPIITPLSKFHPRQVYEGPERFQECLQGRGAMYGACKAIEEAGGDIIPTVFMNSTSGGRVDDAVFSHLRERLAYYVKTEGVPDGVFASLHGATCTESCDDVCGELLAFLRELVGDKVIAASFDLHANITDTMLKNTDIICGYQTYPHLDHEQTGYRAAFLCMQRIRGEKSYQAAASVSVLLPPAGYTSESGPFRDLIEEGKAMVARGDIDDFSIFPVQPWLDIPTIASRIVTHGKDAEKAKHCADVLAKGFYALRDDAQPPLFSVDAIIDEAENNPSDMPVILAESADSPNGGCVGDSPIVAMRLQERGSRLRACMLVIDPAAVKHALEVGVGGQAEFSVGAGFTKDMPGPFKGVGTVRSLHDGYFNTGRNSISYTGGPSAVVRFGNIDILLCIHGAASGSPFLFSQFGMNPLHYDLIVVKANTSFRASYKTISNRIFLADTHGAGASNLKQLSWSRLPKGIYPFDLPENYRPEPAKIW